jgi:hypothetical protein
MVVSSRPSHPLVSNVSVLWNLLQSLALARPKQSRLSRKFREAAKPPLYVAVVNP